MSIREQIDSKLKEAMLARERFLTGVLRDLKSAFLYEEVAKKKRDEGLSEDEYLAVIAREVKKRNDSIEIYTAAGDKARAEQEQAELGILQGFLPEPLSENELLEIVRRVITTGGFGIKDMGRVIGDVKKEVGARGDGATIARLVKSELK
ncbi:MAG: GatB/YqeY domain-containing protein [Candidatus Nomurabacteria bacterium]|nr:GatB/YqeY domain-containing protein [Candidatus Nomurabacteria bacterium]